MNINNCGYNTRGNQKCHFNIDCDNVIKNNEVHAACPVDVNMELLNCSKCNVSKICPVLYCNYEKHEKENDKIFKRNFPCKPIEVIPDYRGEYKVCQDYRSLSDKDSLKKDLSQKSKTGFNPGKPDKIEYLRNIDTDSELRLKYRATLCATKKHQQPPCKKTEVVEPSILYNPTCQNYKYYKYNDDMPSYKTKCDKPNNSNILEFNYTKEKETCMFEGLRKVDRLRNIKQPVLFQNKIDIPCNNKLQTGPERTNHRLENIWGNVTRRKYI